MAVSEPGSSQRPSPPCANAAAGGLRVQQSGPRRRWLGALLTLLFVALLVGGAWYLAQRAQQMPPVGAQPGLGRPGGGPGGAGGMVTVGYALAREGELQTQLDALGTVTSVNAVALAPQVSGVLQEVLFTEGQQVKKGQVLARIDRLPLEQALAQARGQRVRDEAQLAMARTTLQRYQTLWGQDSIARQEVDVQAALVKQLEGTLESDRASERTAQINLDYTTLRAPISGRIGLRAVDAGNLVAANSTGIATITQMTPIDVVFAVTQERIADVLAAQRGGKLPVAVLDSARAQTLAEGAFLSMDNQVNTATGTVRAKARFDNATGQLFPNQFVNVRLQLGAVRGVLVPVTAVRAGPQGDYVYVIDDARVAQMRAVRRGLATAEWVLIESGVQAGERVVTEGGDRVKAGAAVQLSGDRPARAASGADGAGARPAAAMASSAPALAASR